MTSDAITKGRSLFDALRAIEETWKEVDRLVKCLDTKLTESLVKQGQFTLLELRKKKIEKLSKYIDGTSQHTFRAYKNRAKRHTVLLSYEFRLAWSLGHEILRSDGSEMKIPLIIAKGTSDPGQEFECYYLFHSPAERAEEEGPTYSVYDRLLYHLERNYSYWAFAVPLFAIATEEDLKREIVTPTQEILKALIENTQLLESKMSIKKLEEEAFKNTEHVFSWREDEQERLLLDVSRLEPSLT